VIYTNYGGRFPTSKQDCLILKGRISEPAGHLKPILPMPGGGMTLERIPDIIDFYGEDVILLASGGIYGLGPDLVENCRKFRHAAGRS
jgi:ribulose-bisphosphate carboxylase large chain